MKHWLQSVLLAAVCCARARAHEPRFYKAGDQNGTVKVYDPSLSQAFYETLHRYQDVTYVFAEALMYANEDAVFYFELLLPDPHSRALCAGVRVDVTVPGHTNHTFVLDGLGRDETKLFEPFVQEPLVRVGKALRFTGTFDTPDGFAVRARGPTNHSRCNVALVFGTEERLSVSTLVLFPYISFMVWDWVYGYIPGFWILAMLLPISLATLTILCFPPDENQRNAAYASKVLGFCFFVGIWFTRIYAFARAGSYGAVPTASEVGWALAIVFVDTFFVVLVGVNTFSQRFRESSEACLQGACCTCITCFGRCMTDAEEVRGLFVLYILLLIGAIFMFSPGFFVGPFFVLFGIVLARGGCAERPSCRCSRLFREPQISYRIWS
jgi:hypothetical protein